MYPACFVTDSMCVLLQWHMYPKLGAKFMSDETAQLAGALNMRHRCFLHPTFLFSSFSWSILPRVCAWHGSMRQHVRRTFAGPAHIAAWPTGLSHFGNAILLT